MALSVNPSSSTTTLPAQLTDTRVQYVAGKLTNAGKADIANMILDNPGLIQKYACAVDKA
jgi:hypothetical protein